MLGDISDKKADKAPEEKTTENNFGLFLKEVGEAKKDPNLKKRIDGRKNQGRKESEAQIFDLKELADNLAHTAKKIEVRTEKQGEEERHSVEIALDLAKFEDLPKRELTAILPPEVKQTNLKIYSDNPDGTEKLEFQKVVFRDIREGKLNYFYKDENGRDIAVELPLYGRASLTITPDDLENKSRAEVLNMMKQELKVITAQKLRPNFDDAATPVAIEPDPSSIAPFSSLPSPVAPLPSTTTPPLSPGSASMTGRLYEDSDSKMPETINGDLDTEIIELPKDGPSPTGVPMIIEYSKNPEVQKGEKHFIYCFHGDHYSARAYLNEVKPHADDLRRAGINAIVVSLEYKPKGSMNSSWNYLHGKIDALLDYFSNRFGQGKIDVVSFSGGYRGVTEFVDYLIKSGNIGLLNTISMLDSTYNYSKINNILAACARAGVKVKAFTGTASPTAGAKAIEKLLRNESPEIRRNFQHIHTGEGHTAVNRNNMRKALAFTANVDLEKGSKTSLAVSNKHEIVTDGDTRILVHNVSPEAHQIIQNFYANEKFVNFSDPFSKRTVKLRETAYRCLQLARQFAQADGYDIRVGCGYRNVSTQRRAFARSDRSGRYVASPGKSWHHSGGAIDCSLVKTDGVSNRSLRSAGSKKQLEIYMNRAGFVRYSLEWWHFEVGTAGWAKIMTKKGILPEAFASRRVFYDRLQA